MTSQQSTIRPRRPFVDRRSYHRWIAEFDRLDETDFYAIKQSLDAGVSWPLISVVMPAFNTPEAFLVEAIESVRAQLYPYWELCIADDASTSPHVARVLNRFQQLDSRIKVSRLPVNGNISVATNRALGLATGEFIAMMDHDDVLAPHALYLVAWESKQFPDANLIYSDSDNLDPEGERCNPFFKPDWDYDLLLGQNYINHLTVFRRSLLQQIGGFRTGYEGSQDYEILLRFVEHIDSATIRHIPHVLYHWRVVPNSFARTQLTEANACARRAIEEHLCRCGQLARVTAAADNKIFHQVQRFLPATPPSVSVIVAPGVAGEVTTEWIVETFAQTDYPDYELIVPAASAVADQVSSPRCGGGRSVPLRRVDCSKLEQPSVLNALAADASGNVLVFMDTHSIPVHSGWLREMVAQALRSDVGLVCPKNTDRAGMVHCPVPIDSVVRGVDGIANDACLPVSRNKQGYFARLVLHHQISAIGDGCLAIRRSLFERVGRFDENLATGRVQYLNLSRKIRKMDLAILWSAHAHFMRVTDSNSGQVPGEEIGDLTPTNEGPNDGLLSSNPNLSGWEGECQLAFPPRVRFSWRCTPEREAA